MCALRKLLQRHSSSQNATGRHGCGTFCDRGDGGETGKAGQTVFRMRPGHPGWIEGELLRGSLPVGCLPSQSATVIVVG